MSSGLGTTGGYTQTWLGGPQIQPQRRPPTGELLSSASTVASIPLAISNTTNESATINNLEKWQIDAIKSIASLGALPQNWDGYGSRPPTEEVRSWARDVALRTNLGILKPPKFSPESDGGIQVDWLSGHNRELELHFEDGAKTVTYLKIENQQPIDGGNRLWRGGCAHWVVDVVATGGSHFTSMRQQDDCVDDPGIADDEVLWRYVAPTQVIAVGAGQWRPTSGVFKDRRHRMSVDMASMTTIAVALSRNPGKFIAQFSVKTVRGMRKCVTQQLDKDPANPAHAVVCPKLSDTEARLLANDPHVWAHAPPPHFIPPS